VRALILRGTQKNCNVAHWQMMAPAMNLDERDRRILFALEADAWLSYGELGKRVNLSASAAQRRVEKLLAAGVIRGAGARISAEALGRPLQLYVLVELRDETSATINGFARRIAAQEGVVEAHYVAGMTDILITLQMACMAEYAAFAERYLNDNPSVKRYKTLTSLRVLRGRG